MIVVFYENKSMYSEFGINIKKQENVALSLAFLRKLFLASSKRKLRENYQDRFTKAAHECIPTHTAIRAPECTSQRFVVKKAALERNFPMRQLCECAALYSLPMAIECLSKRHSTPV